MFRLVSVALLATIGYGMVPPMDPCLTGMGKCMEYDNKAMFGHMKCLYDAGCHMPKAVQHCLMTKMMKCMNPHLNESHIPPVTAHPTSQPPQKCNHTAAIQCIKGMPADLKNFCSDKKKCFSSLNQTCKEDVVKAAHKMQDTCHCAMHDARSCFADLAHHYNATKPAGGAAAGQQHPVQEHHEQHFTWMMCADPCKPHGQCGGEKHQAGHPAGHEGHEGAPNKKLQ